MDRLEAEAKGEVPSGGKENGGSEKLIEAAKNLTWSLTSKQGLRQAASDVLDLLRQHEIDVSSDDIEAKKKVGPIIAANRSKTAAEVVEILAREFGNAQEKKQKAAKKQDAVSKMVGHPDNAAIVTAFQELAELYFKEGNRNAGSTYNKVVNAVKVMDFPVTAKNALSLGKGKTKVQGIGPGSASKMKEFCETGTIGKLVEKRAAAS